MTRITKLTTDPAAADFLTSPDTRYLLGPFMQRETTLSEAAAVLDGVGLSTLHRRVKQMLELNLIEVTREEVRRGHRVKLYRTTSREFVVPLEATRRVDLETYLNDVFTGSVVILSRGIAGAMERSAPHWGFQIGWSEGVYQQAMPLGEAFGPLPSGAPAEPCWYGDLGVRLEPEAARRFQRELQELYERYRQTDGEGEWYFFFAGFAPT